MVKSPGGPSVKFLVNAGNVTSFSIFSFIKGTRDDRSSHIFSYDGFSQLVSCSITEFCFWNYDVC